MANTGDDLWLAGLRVTPDLDSLMYALAGVNDDERGWGRAGETERVSAELTAYGVGWPWFTLGDLDLGTHIARSALLREGLPLSAVVERLTARWPLGVRLLPATDAEVETHVVTAEGELHFEEWWVRTRAALPALGFVQRGVEGATAAPGVREAILAADVVLLAPSNPVVSIGTVLGIPGIREALRDTRRPVVGLSPVIGGSVVRGHGRRLPRPRSASRPTRRRSPRHYGARSRRRRARRLARGRGRRGRRRGARRRRHRDPGRPAVDDRRRGDRGHGRGGAGAGRAVSDARGSAVQPVLAGVVGTLTGFFGSVAVLLAGLTAAGATAAQAASGLAALCVANGVLSIAASLRLRIPACFAWSTPGAALLVAAHPASFGTAVGAFMLAGVLGVVTGAVPAFARWIDRIPPALSGGLLAGVLLPFCLAPVREAVVTPWTVLPLVVVWLVLSRLAPRAAGPVVIVAALVDHRAAGRRRRRAPAAARASSRPALDPVGIVALGVPLYLVTMAGQQLPGIAVLQANDYRPPTRLALVASGAVSALVAPLGAVQVNLAAITGAIMVGPDAGADRSRRWISGVASGCTYFVLAGTAGLVAGLVGEQDARARGGGGGPRADRRVRRRDLRRHRPAGHPGAGRDHLPRGRIRHRGRRHRQRVLGRDRRRRRARGAHATSHRAALNVRGAARVVLLHRYGVRRQNSVTMKQGVRGSPYGSHRGCCARDRAAAREHRLLPHRLRAASTNEVFLPVFFGLGVLLLSAALPLPIFLLDRLDGRG